MPNNEFLVLGCGHSESLQHFNTNAAVINDQGTLLIDCGYTIKHALHQQGLTIGDVDAVFITHVHGDHTFGLERIAFESLFKYQKKVKLIFHESLYHELWEQTLKGSLANIGEGSATLETYFEPQILTGDSFEIFGNHYQIFPVSHTPNNRCFVVNINQRIFYSGDTTAIPEVINSQRFDIGFHDVTLTEANPVHATLSSLLEHYSAKIRQSLYLMGYEDHWPQHLETIKRQFLGLSTQGMRIAF